MNNAERMRKHVEHLRERIKRLKPHRETFDAIVLGWIEEQQISG